VNLWWATSGHQERALLASIPPPQGLDVACRHLTNSRLVEKVLGVQVSRMSTLVAVYNFNLGCVGRCDAKCYSAHASTCHCICGGTNHGAGIRLASDNTRKLAQTWIDRYTAEYPGEPLQFDVPLRQMRLL
jgi:hypothetical protein